MEVKEPRRLPVDADAGEEADAAVQVEVEAEARHLAEGLAEHPDAALRVIRDEEGQRGEVEQVRHPKVQHEDVDVSDLSPAGAHAPQTPHVGPRADHEHGDEHDGQEDVRKGQVDLLAGGRVGRAFGVRRHLQVRAVGGNGWRGLVGVL